MEKGKVKWFNPIKNYGFIGAYSGKDLFVHGSEVKEEREIVEGDEVEFEVMSGQRGDKAVNVRRVGK